MELLEVISDAASNELKKMNGSDLLTLYQKFYWIKCLKSFLISTDDRALFSILNNLKAALRSNMKKKMLLRAQDDPKKDVLDELNYTISKAKESTCSSIIANVLRSRYSRSSEKEGRKDVSKAINTLFVKDPPLKESRALSKTLRSPSLSWKQQLTDVCIPSSFFTERIRPSHAVKLLIALWEGGNSETSVEGFLGRHFDEDRDCRMASFRELWTPADVE